MSTGAGSDSGSSLGGFGAALEAELLRAQSTEEEEESSPRKRQRLGEPAQAGARAQPPRWWRLALTSPCSGPGRAVPTTPGFPGRHVHPLRRGQV
jgi:hypothetical protein